MFLTKLLLQRLQFLQLSKLSNYLILLMLFANQSFALQNIQIIGGNNTNSLIKVALVNFAGDSADNNITDIIANDLNITGQFKVTKYSSLNSVTDDNQYIINGVLAKKSTAASPKLHLSYRLVEVNPAKSQQLSTVLLNQNLDFNSNLLRKAAHNISNNVYYQLTNVKGVFTSKIAYIVHNNKQYSIIIADYDGYNPKIMLTTKAPLASLAWNSNNTQIAYVSFESGKPVVYVQNIYEAKRYKVADFNGSNSSPAFSKTAANLGGQTQKLAVTLTKDDGSHIYLINNQAFSQSASASELIDFGTIDTEASFSDDGKLIVFTSNHDGGPQLFMANLERQPLQNIEITRLTFNLGNYNTTGRFSHDGTKITFINRNDRALKSYILDMANKTAYPISINTDCDLAPSFAPNDQLILFSSGGAAYIANITGTKETKINAITAQEIIDMRWSN